MLYDMKLKLVTPFLGDIRTNDNIRRFRYDKEGRVETNLSAVQWSLSQAAESMYERKIITSSVRIMAYTPLKVSQFHRSWKEKGQDKEEMFESFNANATLTIPVFIPTAVEYDATERERKSGQLPSPEELRNLFQFVGEVIGLSPWGSKFGYGRFNVTDLNVRTPKD